METIIHAQITEKQASLLKKLKELEKIGYGEMNIFVHDGKIRRIEIKKSILITTEEQQKDPFKDLAITDLTGE